MQYDFKGLSEAEAGRSRETHGSNALTPQEVETFWDKLLESFKDPMIVILLVALGIVTVLAVTGFAHWYEGVGIAAAVALATLVSTASEFKNEQTFQKLQEEASKINVNVFRDGHIRTLKIDDIVVGDLILLQPGDKIPADGRLRAGTLKVHQAVFTGEAEPVKKTVGEPAEDSPRLDDPHALFRGTTVEDGEAVLEVRKVGDGTRFGELAKELTAEERIGPLRVKLARLAQGISKFGYIGASFIAAAFIFKAVLMDNSFAGDQILAYIANWQQVIYDVTTAAILAVIIIVVAVPEGLPMMIAIVLAQNMRKLLNSHVLVRQLLGIETSGSLNILFCDKTGTITKGQLEAVGFMAMASGEDPGTATLSNHDKIEEVPGPLRTRLDLSVRKTSTCVFDPTAEREEACLVGGNMTERALFRFILPEADWRDQGPAAEVTRQIPFNSMRTFSGSEVEWDGRRLSLGKGAAEIILSRCNAIMDAEGATHDLSEAARSRLTETLNTRADEGYRIIAVAIADKEMGESETLPDGLTLLGFVSIRDELRETAPGAISTLRNAGVKVVMLTGDKLGTARAIARDAGLLAGEADVVIESSDMAELDDGALKETLPNLKVIARCLPSDKKRLVRIAQETGYVVGMTGDGVNDAPALNNCDVGFGMGSGSEVAKEASEIVILDDNVESIVNAVHYGRTIYRSIQKFITFQLTVNVAAILVAFLGPFLGYRLPLTMIQLLWINLIMDTLAALAFSGEPPLPRHMREAPKRRDEPIIDRNMWSSILLNGLFMTALSILFFEWGAIRSAFHSEAAFMTGFFGFFVFINNFNKFNVRVEDVRLFHHILDNRGFLRIVGLIFGIQILMTYLGGTMFRTVALQPGEWLLITVMAAAVVPFDLARKLIRDFRRK